MVRRLEEIVPYVPIAGRIRTGISIFSYCGTITFGLTGDFAANPDLDVLARGIEHGVSELLTAARKHSRSTAAAGRYGLVVTSLPACTFVRISSTDHAQAAMSTARTSADTACSHGGVRRY